MTCYVEEQDKLDAETATDAVQGCVNNLYAVYSGGTRGFQRFEQKETQISLKSVKKSFF